MLGRQDRLEDLSCQNMYNIPPNDGFLKLVSTYAGTRCDDNHYVDVDVAGSTGQPEPGIHTPRLCHQFLAIPH